MRIQAILLPSLGAALLLACAASSTSPMENEAVGAANFQPQDHDSASDAIAVARCHREQTCGHVGDGELFSSRKGCELAMRERTRSQIAACDHFDAIVLDQCMQDIRAIRCGSDMSTVDNVESCRARRLCKD
jgi:hypothetical protein